MGQLPLFICPPPPLLINLFPPLFSIFHRLEAHGWRQDGKNVNFFGGRPNEGKAQIIRHKKGGRVVGRVRHKNSLFLRLGVRYWVECVIVILSYILDVESRVIVLLLDSFK